MTELRARLLNYRLSLVRPLVTAKASIGHRSGIVVELSDGQFRGYGDAAPLPGWSLETLDQARRSLVGWVEGADLAEPPAMVESVHGAGAIADAQASLNAARAGLPLHRFLDSDSGQSIQTNALVSAPDLGGLAAEVDAALNAGYLTVKLKVAGTSAADDVDRVRLVRDALGPDRKLRIDANGGWGVREAADALKRLEPFDIEYCEDPVASIGSLSGLRRSVGVPIAVDGPVTTGATLDAIVSQGGADVVIVKPAFLGGAASSVQWAKQCQEAGLGVVVTTLIDSVVGRTNAAHVAATVGTDVAHGLSTGRLLAHDIAADPAPERPTMVLSSKPGLGIDLSALAGPDLAP